MNKSLFWTGISFQLIQAIIGGILFLSSVSISKETLFVIGFIFFNIVSVIMILIGAVIGDK